MGYLVLGTEDYSDDLIEKPLKIGRLYNLGQVDSEYIDLDINSLTSHLFITGSIFKIDSIPI